LKREVYKEIHRANQPGYPGCGSCSTRERKEEHRKITNFMPRKRKVRVRGKGVDGPIEAEERKERRGQRRMPKVEKKK